MFEKGYIYGYISASAITDIHYIAKKELKSRNLALGLIKNLLLTTRVAAVTGECIHEALGLEWDDFEDSVQYISGLSIPVSYIITRNLNDYANSQIGVLTPNRFLGQIIRK